MLKDRKNAHCGSIMFEDKPGWPDKLVLANINNSLPSKLRKFIESINVCQEMMIAKQYIYLPEYSSSMNTLEITSTRCNFPAPPEILSKPEFLLPSTNQNNLQLRNWSFVVIVSVNLIFYSFDWDISHRTLIGLIFGSKDRTGTITEYLEHYILTTQT